VHPSTKRLAVVISSERPLSRIAYSGKPPSRDGKGD